MRTSGGRARSLEVVVLRVWRVDWRGGVVPLMEKRSEFSLRTLENWRVRRTSESSQSVRECQERLRQTMLIEVMRVEVGLGVERMEVWSGI